ncbi:MAG: hypothetical protein ACTSWY_13240, partial [Promethearchaeota archaeon]
MTMNPLNSFKCKICKVDKPREDSVSLESKICCTCFTSIQIHERVREKIIYFKRVIKEEKLNTPIRNKKMSLLEKMNDIFSFARADILQISIENAKYYIEEVVKSSIIKALRFWKKKYVLREYERNYYDFNRMVGTLKAYQRKINRVCHMNDGFVGAFWTELCVNDGTISSATTELCDYYNTNYESGWNLGDEW